MRSRISKGMTAAAAAWMCAVAGLVVASCAGNTGTPVTPDPSGNDGAAPVPTATDASTVSVPTPPPVVDAGIDTGSSGNGNPPPPSGPPYIVRAQKGELGPPDLDEVEHMCALLTACDKLPLPPNVIPADFTSCVKKFSDDMTSPAGIQFSLTLRECGLEKNSCNELRNCALRGTKGDSCQGRGHQAPVGYCDPDGRALTCFKDSIIAVRDCPRGGEQCVVRGGEAQCVLGPCPDNIKEGQPKQCSASGTRVVHCDKGKLVSLDCAAFGLRCASASEGGPAIGCATQGATCADKSKRCDGATTVGCFNGHEVRIDCGGAGLACTPSQGSTPVGACVAPPPGAGACDPGAAPKCDGNKIKYCFAGKQRSFNCGAVNFTKCETDKKGARCAN